MKIGSGERVPIRTTYDPSIFETLWALVKETFLEIIYTFGKLFR